MTSFQLSVSPHRRVAARFVDSVRRRLQRAYAEAPDIKQSHIANSLGVHRSVITRQLRGYQDMTLGRVAELSWALGWEPEFDLVKPTLVRGSNHPPTLAGARSDTGEARKPIFFSSDATVVSSTGLMAMVEIKNDPLTKEPA